MAKRATEPDTGHSEVVDLNNDARWQARLDEARARRAEALKLKGQDEKPKRRPRKPWEEDEATALAAEKHQRPLDDDGLDFHDRMNALQKVLKDKEPAPTPDVAPAPVPERERNWSPAAEAAPLEAAPVAQVPVTAPVPPVAPKAPAGPPVDSLFDDPAFQEPEPAEADEPEFVPLSEFVDPLPPRRAKVTRKPWIEETEEEDTAVVVQDVQPELKKAKAKSDGMPFFLGVGLVALLAMPFFNLLPPLTRGPDQATSPTFALQPAFGITAAMVEFPALTQSGEFVPTSSVAPGRPRGVVPARAPAFARTLPSIAAAPLAEAFEAPEITGWVDTSLAAFARKPSSGMLVSQAMLEAQSGEALQSGALPGVLAPVAVQSLTPRSRP